MANAFIDTNIYISYSLNKEFEDSHEDSLYLFRDSSFDVYSSLTVHQELNKLLRRRKRLYRSLIKHLAGGLSLDEFISQSGLPNNSDRDHIRRVIRILRDEMDAMGYLRSLDRSFSLGIDEGCDLTVEFIERSNDGNCKSYFSLEGFHEPDNCIISDFIGWAIKGNGCIFFTTDGGIISRRESIFSYIRDYLYRDCDHIRVDHISKVKSRDK